MRSRLGGLPVLALLAALSVTASSGPAQAGGGHDRVYADSFGNLIVQSPGGYKRIVVGAGHLARQLNDYQQTGEETSLEEDASVPVIVESRPCYRPPVLVKGRSYMYGFDQGEIPLRGGDCR